MQTKPRILVISPSHLATDPRVYRQLELLQAANRVTAAGYGNPQIPGVEFVPIALEPRRFSRRVMGLTRLLFRRFTSYRRHLAFARNARAALAGREFELVIANDTESWSLGLELRGRGRVLFDAHEYAPREFEDVWWWRLLYQPYKFELCRRFLPRADGVTTVCTGIADEYSRVFGVRPLVVMNAPPRRTSTPMPAARDRIRIIHHGAAIRSRKIEAMIRMLDHLDERFHLDLMLTPNDAGYLTMLHDLARTRPRVRFRPPVPMQLIPEEIRDYEIGLFLLEPTNFNYLHALPNKFFEFIQARLMVAIGPSPEMAQLVRKFECGVVADDFQAEALASKLTGLTAERIDDFKQNAHRAAATLCWEHERVTLQREVDRLLALGPCAE